ncbi:uncharacterized protein LOC119913343 isoform X2 [Micropterus salmoides]|uniref:uncharacterized protein LOC119913343 isoform X2 n=1 Tax=Micropterus salmoides TaxID=27706 RepID=UPI0018EC4205|nr:uncharacterized protein LOC119913343 isoform X2 [Micropterus salmoides]
MSTKPKSHKAMGDGEWMVRLRAFASSGVWPSGGNRPSQRQQKWHDLYQKVKYVKIEKCPMQAHRLTTLFGGSVACNCGFHAVKPATQTPAEARTESEAQSMVSDSDPGATPQFVASDSDPGATTAAPRSFVQPHVSLSMDETGGVSSATAGAAASFWLPGELSKTIPVQDQSWIASTLFPSGKLRPDLELWYEPPVPALIYHQTPAPDHFFTHRLMVWMPYHLWKVRVSCPACGKQLTGYGVHKRARKVLDIDRYYLMLTETLRCTVCSLNYLSTSQTVRDQLDLPHQKLFEVILTRKYACDIRVIRLLRDRTLGNSPARLIRQLRENHGEKWLNRLAHYLGECANFMERPGLFPVICQEPPEPIDVPTSRWLLSVYSRDILSRLDHIKASITSTFGSILKMNSTEKITKKLAGHGRGTALCVTSIGNEVGQVLTSVLSVQEGPGLDKMVSGVMERYSRACVPPPVLLYVDCGCCVSEGESKLQTRFAQWPDIHIRLDIWHFMKRLAIGCTTDAHPLYPTFMGYLSACIFEWDAGDLSLLRQAKKEQLRQEGVPALTDLLVDRRISKKELNQYCRRRTRGEEGTISLIEQLLQTLGGANGRDLMGVPLLDQVRMEHIWRVQKRHVRCIQDVPGVQLYTETGDTTKGGVVLTRYRCARGSTSLEAFHFHLNRFIPGTSANALNFQLYLLEGLNRWNQDQGTVAVTTKPSSLLTYAGDVVQCVNTNSLKVFGRVLVPNFRPSARYTGELLGVDYLLSQTGQPLAVNPDSEETEGILEDVDEGEEEEDDGFEKDTVSSLLDDWSFSTSSLSAASAMAVASCLSAASSPAASSLLRPLQLLCPLWMLPLPSLPFSPLCAPCTRQRRGPGRGEEEGLTHSCDTGGYEAASPVAALPCSTLGSSAGDAATAHPCSTLGSSATAHSCSTLGSSATAHSCSTLGSSATALPCSTLGSSAGDAATAHPCSTLGSSATAHSCSALGSSATAHPCSTLGSSAGDAATAHPCSTLGSSATAHPCSTLGSSATAHPCSTLGSSATAHPCSTLGSSATAHPCSTHIPSVPDAGSKGPGCQPLLSSSCSCFSPAKTDP